MKIYTLQDYENIIWNFSKFVVSDESIKIIENISNQVTDPNYIRTPNFSKQNNSQSFNKKKKHNYTNSSNLNEEDWKIIRNFKKTEINKDQNDNQKDMSNIRLLLNKISNKNFEDVMKSVLEKIDSMLKEESISEENFTQINEIIFSNAGTNKVLAEVYANTFKIIINKYDIMREIFDKNFKNFMTLFTNIEYVDPNEDYDKFCSINLVNEKRRSTSLFLCNLLKNEILKNDDIMHVIFQLQNLLFTNIEKEGFIEQNSEISENLYILITNSNYILKKHPEWESIINNVDMIKKMKAKEKPSLSNKIIFKHMDIFDYYNKNK